MNNERDQYMSADYSCVVVWHGTSKVKASRRLVLVILSALFLNVGSAGLVEARAQGTVLEGTATVWRQATEWISLPFDNPSVMIQSSNNNPIMDNKGRIEVLLLGGSQPLINVDMSVYRAVKNITGQWSTSDNVAYVRTDNSGLVTIEVEPDNYALTIEGFDERTGTYGVSVLRNSDSPVSMIPFNVRQGEVVAVLIRLAKLVVGVTSADGKSALPNKYVYVYPQTTDIAGNPIPQAGFGNSGRSTSVEGTCVWYLGKGTYSIRVDNSNQDTYLYNVEITPGEEKQIVLTGD